MGRKIARKVLNFELAMIKVPLSVFEDTIGDRLPADSALRRVVQRASETIDVVAEAAKPRSGKRPVRMAEPATARKATKPGAKKATKPSATKTTAKRAGSGSRGGSSSRG